ncbi:enoyl-CoA hydratase [Virgibacillus phasianinus]|uniref:Enoyl-CoA hydratase n=1 Tax=Virgibacillus phasianinus TaxID=2017483 RepID=A0A220U2Q4_9BACI|nr:enoyl-CoA hydratase [Virgibacillus phasianinus]ASK62438.1 enoyl-CoA hydratase [Virgibacillus phasianinus]
MKKQPVVTWFKQRKIATIVIDNPPVNVLSGDVILQLAEVIGEIEADESISVVILTGGGEKMFVAGGNIKEFPDWTGKGVDYAKEKSLGLQHPLNKLERLAVPTIAALNGSALGGGCELAMSCDLRIAEEQIQIGLPEITLGLFPGAGGTQRLPRLVGKAKAKELIFTGRLLLADEAMATGLVTKIVGEGESMNVALQLAEKISSFSKEALLFAKKSIDDGYELSLADGLQLEAKNFGHVFQTENVKVGINAFIEKQKPNFNS